jgi:DNA polymerase-1
MTHPKKARYMLVDGNALIHRGYHAIPVLNTKKGEQVNAVYGFTTILLRAIKDIKPTHIVCTFDLKGPTFRHDKFKDYKATRVKGDQELYDQIPRVKEVVKALNMQIFELAGFEADDLLGTLSKKICEQNKHDCEVMILTGDMDTLQLVNDCVRVYTMRKGISDVVIYDPKAVRARYGFNPDQVVEYKALRGDPSDNIPGVKGIGEKGAGELVKEFKTIDNLYKTIHREIKELGIEITNPKLQIPNKYQISKIKNRILNLLVNQEEQVRMSYELSQIDCNVPVKIEIEKYSLDGVHLQNTVKLFQELEFRSLINKLPSNTTPSANASTPPLQEGSSQELRVKNNEEGQEVVDDLHNSNLITQASSIGIQNYQFVNTEEKLEKVIKLLAKAKEVILDTETTGLDVINDKLVGVGLAMESGQAFYIPASLFLASIELKEILESGSILSKAMDNEALKNNSSKIKIIGHNIKFDIQILQANSYKLQASFDTMIASYLLNAGTRQHGLDALAFNELGYQMQPITDLIGVGKSQITMDQVPSEKVSWYCCEDVDMTLRLKEIFVPRLKEERLEKVFNEIEMPMVDVLSRMELNGIILNTKFIKNLSAEAEIEINELESQIYKLSGQEFNINSPKQMKEVLFDKMGLVPVMNKKTKTGLSTAAGELEKMLGQHPVIAKIMQYREVSKLQSTYLLALPEMVNKKTGRIHTNYQQTIAATGRLSSTDPNLQNIPVKGEGMGSKIRQAFVAEKGCKLLSIDYSQIELRVVAHLAGDKKMLEVFQKGDDIHSKTAMEIFGVTEDNITKDMRRDAKTINFGILYGLSSFGLSSRIGEVSAGEAKQFIAKYFAAYPKVEQYIEQVKLQVREAGFVQNELGRRRKFPEIKSSQFFIRAAAERAAVNFPIQSLAADVIKVAMINIDRVISESFNHLINKLDNQEIKMLLQVHDELVFEVKEDKVEYWAKKLIPLMENAIKLSVPVKVEAKVGDNWGEMVKLEL